MFTQIVDSIGWGKLFLVPAAAVTLHVYAAMRGLSSSAEILLGAQFGFAIGLQFSFAMVGATVLVALISMPILMLLEFIRPRFQWTRGRFF